MGIRNCVRTYALNEHIDDLDMMVKRKLEGRGGGGGVDNYMKYKDIELFGPNIFLSVQRIET